MADDSLEDLLGTAEIRQHVRVTMAGRLWTEKASFWFNEYSTMLGITLDWGLVIKLDLSSGKIS